VRNVEALWRLFARWPRATLHASPELEWFESPLRFHIYNGVFRTGDLADRPLVIATVRGHFARAGKPFWWVVSPRNRATGLAEELASAGLSHLEDVEGMARSLARPLSRKEIPGVRIEAVRDAAGAQAYRAMQQERWQLSSAVEDDLRDLHRYMDHLPTFTRVIAWLDGKPVGKAASFVDGEVAGIYGVYTRPPARGRGIGEAVTAEAIDAAHRLGARRVVLHSEPKAVRLYERMGFSKVCPLPLYVGSPQAARSGAPNP